jgi:hypothetical protein
MSGDDAGVERNPTRFMDSDAQRDTHGGGAIWSDAIFSS